MNAWTTRLFPSNHDSLDQCVDWVEWFATDLIPAYRM